MDEDFEEYNEDEVLKLVEKFETKIKNNQTFFFDVEEYELLIDYYVENENIKKTDILLNHALNQHPDSVSILLKKAQVYVFTDKPDKALELLKYLEKMEPDNSDVFFTKGAIYSQLHRSEKAIEEYKKAISKSENIDEIYINIGFEYEHLNNYIKSIEYFKKALTIAPENDMILFELSFCFEQTGKLLEGIDFFNEYIDKYPYSKAAWSVLGTIYNLNNNKIKAIDAFDFAIAIDDSDSGPYYQKASVYYSEREYKKAIEVYHEILNLNLEYYLSTPYFFIAECYEKIEEYDKAIEFYSQSIQIEENNPDAWIGRGICFFEINKIKQAINDVRKGIKLGEVDNMSDYKLILAEMLVKQDIDEALKIYEEVVYSDPDNTDAWLDFSDALRENGEIAKAIDLLIETSKNYPEKVEFIYRLSALLLLNNEIKNALNTLLIAVELDKDKASLTDFFDYMYDLKLDKYFLDILKDFKNDLENNLENNFNIQL